LNATTQAPALDELVRDALTARANIGVSRAAGHFRDMVGQQVLLSVPAVTVATRDRAAQIIGDQETSGLVATGRLPVIFRGVCCWSSRDQQP
jgi:chemotaxis protein CheC